MIFLRTTGDVPDRCGIEPVQQHDKEAQRKNQPLNPENGCWLINDWTSTSCVWVIIVS
jgi:hypothetical protein